MWDEEVIQRSCVMLLWVSKLWILIIHQLARCKNCQVWRQQHVWAWFTDHRLQITLVSKIQRNVNKWHVSHQVPVQHVVLFCRNCDLNQDHPSRILNLFLLSILNMFFVFSKSSLWICRILQGSTCYFHRDSGKQRLQAGTSQKQEVLHKMRINSQ